MSSQLEILQRSTNQGQKLYRFWLSNESETTVELSVAPDGWTKNEVEYQRDKVYHSVFRSVSVKELTFFKEGRNFIQTVYESQGIDAQILLTVKILNKTTYAYDDYHTGIIDLATYEINEIGVKCGLIDSSFNQKFKNRDATEVNLLSLTTIEGVTVSEFDADTVKFPDTSIYNDDNWEDGYGGTISATSHLVPLTLTTTPEFSEVQDQDYTDPTDTNTSGFFSNSTTERKLNVSGTIQADVNLTGSGSVEFHILRINSSNVIQSDATVLTVAVDTPSPATVNDSFDYDLVVNVGDSLLLQCELIGGNITNIQYAIISMDLVEDYTGTPETFVTGFPFYEAFLRAGQHITDQENCIYSEYFGRTDTPIITYDADGVIGFITRGLFIRQADPVYYPIPVTFRDLFQSLDAVYSLGASIEDFSGVKKIRIEERAHFYDAHVIVDISDRLRSQDIEKSIFTDGYYTDIETGYQSFEYDAVDGLYEYNTKSVFTTVVKAIKQKLNNISKYRADNQGLRLLLNAASVNSFDNKDIKGDDDIFIIDTFDNSGTIQASTNEDFAAVSGSVYAEQSFNLKLTPARNMLRHGSEIKAGLLNNLSSYLRWQTSDKNTQLATRLTGEVSPLFENADILVNDLAAPIWYNEIYKVKAPLTAAEKQAIESNMNGIIKIDTDKYGWILNLKTSNYDNMADFELLRVNISNLVPIEL